MRDLRASYRAASACAALFLAACGHSDGDALPPPEPPAIGVERVFPALAFAQPVAMLQAPNDGSRWFVVEQAGRVQVFDNAPQVAALAIFADISGRVTSGGEMGLLGMAFPPTFPTDARVFLSYTHRPPGGTLVSRISEFPVSGGSVDAANEVVLLTIDQPEENHNGGHIAFGPDGFLYIGIGDGGGGNDQHPPIGNGQRTTTLLGKVLRIDVSTPGSYTIPPDNPYSGTAAKCDANGTGALPCPEIYALGFRNPWRFSSMPTPFGSATSGRASARRSTAWYWGATTDGAASRARAPRGWPAARRLTCCRRSPSMGAASAPRSRAVSSTGAARSRTSSAATCSGISSRGG